MKNSKTFILVAAIGALALASIGCGNFAYLNSYEEAMDTWRNGTVSAIYVDGVSQFTTGAPSPFLVDLDRDGTMDLVVGDSTGYVYFIKNGRTDGFETADFYPLQHQGVAYNFGSHGSPIIIDTNYDGAWEMGVGDQAGAVWYVNIVDFTEATGNLGWGRIPIMMDGYYLNAPAGRATLAWTDVNNDGLEDVLVGDSTGTIAVYNNIGQPGSAQFMLESEISLDLGGHVAMAVVDLNQDGFNEYVIGNAAGEIYVCQGDQKPCARLDSMDVSHDAKPTVGDINHDGLMDLVVGDGDGQIWMLIANPNP